MGRSAWLYDGATTIDIGLTGPEHTRNNGYKYSLGGFQDQLNEAGQVIGYSERYNGGSTRLGQDAWVYDPLLDQTFALQLSTRSDGYAFSSAAYLGEDGLVLGTYTLFDALGTTNLGSRAFYFTIADGLHDLGFACRWRPGGQRLGLAGQRHSRQRPGPNPRLRQAHLPIRRPNGLPAHACRPRAAHLGPCQSHIDRASICTASKQA